MTWGFDVFVQLVIAAMTTLPCESSTDSPSSWTATERAAGAAAPLPGGGGAPRARRGAGGERVGDGLVVAPVHVVDPEASQRRDEGLLGRGQRHPVLRAPRSREARLPLRQAEADQPP